MFDIMRQAHVRRSNGTRVHFVHEGYSWTGVVVNHNDSHYDIQVDAHLIECIQQCKGSSIMRVHEKTIY